MLQLIPRDEKYFALFDEMGAHIREGVQRLVQILQDVGVAPEQNQQIKELEHLCDELMHGIVVKLNQSFITPIDREDIYALANALDDVMDLIDSIASHIQMFRITEVTPVAKQMGAIFVRSVDEMTKAVSKIQSHREALPHFVELHRLENEGDHLYRQAMEALFANGAEAIHIITWKDLYEILEKGIDRCEDVANVLESIMLKHA